MIRSSCSLQDPSNGIAIFTIFDFSLVAPLVFQTHSREQLCLALDPWDSRKKHADKSCQHNFFELKGLLQFFLRSGRASRKLIPTYWISYSSQHLHGDPRTKPCFQIGSDKFHHRQSLVKNEFRKSSSDLMPITNSFCSAQATNQVTLLGNKPLVMGQNPNQIIIANHNYPPYNNTRHNAHTTILHTPTS